MYRPLNLAGELRACLVVLFICFLPNLHLRSQDRPSEQGLPFIRNYYPKEYGAASQAWSVIEDDRGILYFGIQGDILEYDGVRWQKVLFEGSKSTVVVRALSKDKSGTIYYGSYGDLGYLERDSAGRTHAVSLLNYVPAGDRNFFDVWSINITEEGIYFQSREKLIRLKKDGNDRGQKWQAKVWKPKTAFMFGFHPDGNYYVHEQNLGLFKMIQDSLQFIPGSEFLGKERVQIMLPLDDQNVAHPRLLIGMFYSGLYLYDGNTFSTFNTEADPIIKSGLVLYKGIKLNNGTFVLSTTGRGLIVIDDHGKLLKSINRRVGLQDESVYGVYISKSGTLWLAMDNGISRVEINSQFTQFTLQSGITTSVLSVNRFQGDLYVGTTNGILKFNREKKIFEANKIIPQNQIFALLNQGGEMLVGGDGLFYIRDGQTVMVKRSVAGDLTFNSFFVPSFYPNLLLAGATTGVGVFIKQPGSQPGGADGFKYVGLIPGIREQVWSFGEDSANNVWAGTQNNLVMRIAIPSIDGSPQIERAHVDSFGINNGLKNSIGSLTSVNRKPYFLWDSGYYRFDAARKHFVNDTTFGSFNHGGGNEDGIIYQDSLKRVWVRLGKETRIALPNGAGGYTIKAILQSISDRSVAKIYAEKNGITWICTTDGLIRYDESKEADSTRSFATLLRTVKNGDNFLQASVGGSRPPELESKNNVLRFEFAAPFFEQEEKTLYKTWLEGFEPTWTAWDKNYYKEYTNLSPGKYTFHVKALSIYKTESTEATYHFIILPPWYNTWWAYLLYAVLALGIIYLIIRWRTKKLKEQHRVLEQTVADRTSQLSQRVAELGVINGVQEGLVAQMSMDGIYTMVGDKIRDLFDAQTVVIRTFDYQKRIENYKYTIEKGKRLNIPPRPFDKFSDHLVELRKPLLISNNFSGFIKEFSEEANLEGEVPKSAIFVPMIIGDVVIGNLSLQNVDHENAFTESDVKLLETLSNSMSVALENARLFDETTRLLQETEKRSAELSIINSVQEGLAKELHMDAIYELVGDKLSEVLNSYDVDIRLFYPEKNEVHYPYVRDQGKLISVAPQTMVGMSKHVYDTGEPLIINEKLEEKMVEFGSVIIPGTSMEKSFLAVPIITGNAPVGMVSMANYEKENAFSDSDVRLLQTVVAAMSVALENARLFDETNRLLKETEQKTSELGVINMVQDDLVREINTQRIYEVVGNRICKLFDTQTVIIRTFNSNTNEEEWQYAMERGEKLDRRRQPVIWANKQLVQTKQPILVNEGYVEYAKQHGGSGVSTGLPPKSAVFVPIIVGDVVRGSVSLQNVEKENAFKDTDVRLLSTLANSMSVALENARLFDETKFLLADAKQRASELSTVNNISRAAASKLNIGELINLVGDQLKDLFKANIVYLALLDAKTKMIDFPYQYGDDMPPMRLGEGLTSRIILSGEPMLVNTDVHEHSDKLGLKRVGIPAASYLGVPIPVGDEIIGVLSVQSTEQQNRFDENDQRLLMTIASSIGVALRNARLFEEVELARKEAEAATKVAEKANTAKSAFLSTVSHELRTPLTSVLGFAKIIRKRLEEKIFPEIDTSNPKTEKTVTQISENLQVVISEGERLTHLINDVLDLAKIEAGKMEWNFETVSIIEVVERAIAATTSLFEQKDLALKREIASDVPEISGDRDKLIQVVINLFSNAVKFTDHGSVGIKISGSDDDIIVSVTDTGIGIAEEDYHAVFEQFKQVGGDTLTDKPKGTGLGLPICKEIIEHHGGKIWLESERGKGSIFSFSIPVMKKDAETGHPLEFDMLIKQLKEQVANSHINGSDQHSNILVVDDDDSIRSLLHQELSDAGYLIEEAVNGKQALEMVRRNRPDLIILDVMMPEMNGFDVAAVLKNDPQTMDIPIIVLSIVQDKSRGFRVGVDRYLTKPINTTELFAEVGTLIEQGKSKKKVMVVDEDSSAVRSLIEVLQQKGYIVMESDGKELMEKAIHNKPDIIILNSMLSDKQEIVKSLRFEKGLENVLFLIYQ